MNTGSTSMQLTINRLSPVTSYRFTFNGKEADNQVYGTGNLYDYGFRIYNPRLGKFLSVDPLTKEYPWYTPYQFAGNKPIWAMDRDGLEEWYSNIGSSLPALMFKESNAYVSDIKPVAFGPFSPAYAESQELSPMPVLNLPEIVVTPSTSFVPELLTPRNNDYSPYIPTANDFVDDFVKLGTAIDDKANGGGGIIFTSETGQGQESRKGTNADAQIENIDLLMSVISASTAAAESRLAVGYKAIFKQVADAIGIGVDVKDNLIGKETTQTTHADSTFCGTCKQNVVTKDTSEHVIKP